MRVFISGPFCVSPVSNLHFNTVFNNIGHILYNYILYFYIKLNTAAFVIVTILFDTGPFLQKKPKISASRRLFLKVSSYFLFLK